MTAHIFLQKQGQPPAERCIASYDARMISTMAIPTEGQNLYREDGIPNSRSQFRTAPPRWSPERKQGRFSSRKQTAAVRSDTVPQNRRQALVTKILLWSRNQSRGCQINQIQKKPCRDLLTKKYFRQERLSIRADAAASHGWAASRLPWAGLSIFVKNISVGRRFSRSAAHRSELRPS